MKRIIIFILLCFAAMVSVASFVVADAALAAPQFLHCASTAVGFETAAKCKKLEGAADFKPGFSVTSWVSGEPKNKFTGTAGKNFLREKGPIKTEIECEKSTSVGEITGASTVGKVSVTYAKCKEVKPGAASCRSTSPLGGAGEIITKSLKGSLVYLKAGGVGPIGLLLESEAGNFVEIECGNKFSVTGSIIGEIPTVFTGAGKMIASGELIFAENTGKTAQQWTKVEEAGAAHELLALGLIASTLASIETITFEEEGEIK